jgi:hypothetical protein
MDQKQVHLSVPKKSNTKKTLLRDNYVLEDFYQAVQSGRLDSVHVPHSDVFFVKAAMEDKLPHMKFTLEDIERAMRLEGWSESRVLKPKRYKFV